ncbi:MAG: hypothetical protein LBR33_06515 [Propionibacteriaceae bacterium]|jgi:hypothetical protein|nr:hypothetical protein [Propionibacteriaceae bacterium]
MTGHAVLELIGWLGSALLVFSVLQAKFMRFRILNLIASAVLVAYNAVLGVWPMAAVNAALVVIDAWFIWKLRRDLRQAKAFAYAPADAGVTDWFVRANGADLTQFHPGFADRLAGAQAALIFHQDRAIGLVAWRPTDGGHGELVADYVIPAYRDYAPGAFVYSPAGPLQQAGLRTVYIDHPEPAVAPYLRRFGFQEVALGRLELVFNSPDLSASSAE